MTVKHQAPASSSSSGLDTLLAGYAGGALPLPLHALVGAHIDLDRESGRFVSDLEAMGGAELERLQPVAVSGRDAILQSIFRGGTTASHEAELPDDPVLTPGLRRFLGVGSSDIAWRMVLPGVKEHVVSSADGIEAKLYWIKAGRNMPAHTHDGHEYTLVLQGGFSDGSGHYRRGDIAMADEDIDHRPVADADEDCICFAVTDAPLKLTGPVGKVFQSLFGN